MSTDAPEDDADRARHMLRTAAAGGPGSLTPAASHAYAQAATAYALLAIADALTPAPAVQDFTVTVAAVADVEKAARAARDAYFDGCSAVLPWDRADAEDREVWTRVAGAVLSTLTH